jgi:hypothetical protein
LEKASVLVKHRTPGGSIKAMEKVKIIAHQLEDDKRHNTMGGKRNTGRNKEWI